MSGKNKLNNERGAITFEFLGILPFFFMFFLLLWQVVASGYAVFTAKTAVNNAAKTFAATNDINEAEQVAIQTIGTSSVINYKNMQVVFLDGQGKFEMKLSANHPLVFVPSPWKSAASLDLNQEAIGKVMVP
ncbi:pilus assembly protein [Heyndrickxia sp. MSNUG]|uniref:pilus assembly protein n=1 Tax=Heyndrickxia sp. MSNUG TaxID=3136677 RepID=UPI003C2E7D01